MANKVPKIRFKGFTDDWEQRKLGEIADKVTKKNKDIVVNEVFTNSAEFGIISQSDFFDKEIANAENIGGYYIVEPNDFVYNPRISTTAPFGPIKRNKLERTGAMSPLYYVFRPHGIDLSYLEWYFQTTCWHAFMRLNGNSGARSDRFAITDKTFNEMPISTPQDIEEQGKIGTFLTDLDRLITLHQRRCEQTKELKKFMLQKMFPKKGEKNPEIRFPGFTDAWEERKLSTESTITAGGDIDKSKLKEFGEYPIFANALTNDGIVGYYDSYYRVEAPAVTVTGRGDVGHAKARKVNFTPVVRLLAVKSNHDVDFLENAINNHKVLVESTGVPQLTAPQLGNYKIFFPTGEEQEKIGSFFKQLDDTITLHQRKCEQLKELKKFMLQNMFPKKG